MRVNRMDPDDAEVEASTHSPASCPQEGPAEGTGVHEEQARFSGGLQRTGPLQSGIGQLEWVNYQSGGRGHHPNSHSSFGIAGSRNARAQPRRFFSSGA